MLALATFVQHAPLLLPPVGTKQPQLGTKITTKHPHHYFWVAFATGEVIQASPRKMTAAN